MKILSNILKVSGLITKYFGIIMVVVKTVQFFNDEMKKLAVSEGIQIEPENPIVQTEKSETND